MITIDGKFMSAALKAVKPAVTGRGGSPVLTCVRLRTDYHNRSLEITGTNLDVTLTATIPCSMHKGHDLDVAVPHAQLAKLVEAIKSDDITIDPIEEGVNVAQGNAVVELRTVPVDEFPRTPEPTGYATELNLDAIADVLPAASTDDSRPILCTVCIDEGSYITTDSYRLYVTDTTGETGQRFLLGREGAAICARYKGNAPAIVGERTVHVTLPAGDEFTLQLAARLVEGEFPPFDNLLPRASTVGSTFTEVFLSDVQKAVKLAGNIDPSTPVRIESHDDGVLIRITAQDRCNVQVVTPGECHHPAAFNPVYLTAALKGMAATELRNPDNLKPAMLIVDAPEFGEGAQRRRLLMPIRVS